MNIKPKAVVSSQAIIQFVLVCFFSLVGAVNAAESPEDVVRKKVELSVVDLLETFSQERQFYETDPDRFFKNMDLALSKNVDFRRIAGRVMGKNGRRATKE